MCAHEQNRKQSISNVMNSFMMVKSTLKRFGFFKPSSELYDGEKIVAWTTGDDSIKITGEVKVYTEKEILITIQSVFFFENYYVIGTASDV